MFTSSVQEGRSDRSVGRLQFALRFAFMLSIEEVRLRANSGSHIGVGPRF
jgi:hypothetical protein